MNPQHRRCLNNTYLTPTQRTDPSREGGEEPRLNLAESGEESEDGGPYASEEDENKDEDFPFLKFGAP